MSSKIKHNQLKEILPLLWNSYEHMFTVRKTNTQNSINFLLVVVSFLSAISISLYTNFRSNIFLLPAILQIIALTILLKSFFIMSTISTVTPWFKSEDTLKKLDNKQFEVSTFAVLKAVENSTWVELVEMQKIISKSLALVLFSLYSTFLAGLLLFFKKEMLYVSILILSLGFIWLYLYYRNLPKFDFTNEINRYTQQIEKWLEK